MKSELNIVILPDTECYVYYDFLFERDIHNFVHNFEWQSDRRTFGCFDKAEKFVKEAKSLPHRYKNVSNIFVQIEPK
jgi:hypothetical protein